MNNKLNILAISIALIALIVSIYTLQEKDKNLTPSNQITVEEFDKLAVTFPERMKAKEEAEKKARAEKVAPINDKDWVFGNRNAEITIFEYSDFECPFCKKFNGISKQAVEKYPEKVNFVFRHFPLPFHNPLATIEANAAECAGEQNKFFPYKNEIFARTKSNNGLEVKELDKIATDLKLNIEQFKKCLAEQKYNDKVQADIQSGIAAGIQGTPGVIIKNNKTGKIEVMPGAVPLEMVEQAIQKLLK